MRLNKDSEGNFTDEAIEAIEQELKELAEKIGIAEDELGERVADYTHRETYDFIEMELVVMRTVAMGMLNERVTRRLAQVRENKRVKNMLMSLSLVCASIGLAFLGLSVPLVVAGRGVPMSYLVPALVFIILFMALLFATINAQAIDKWHLGEIDIDLELALEVAASAKELIPNGA